VKVQSSYSQFFAVVVVVVEVAAAVEEEEGVDGALFLSGARRCLGMFGHQCGLIIALYLLLRRALSYALIFANSS
jgi:hypothetical protein